MNLLNKPAALGVANGLPRYFSAIGLLPVIVLLTPERFFSSAIQLQTWLPDFTRHYIERTEFPAAMTIFWVVGPSVALINSILCVRHVNSSVGYSSYLARRAAILRSNGTNNRFGFVLGIVAFVALYLWSTVFYQVEPRIIGAAPPTNSRLSMVLLHASALGLLLPAAFAALITELRAAITSS